MVPSSKSRREVALLSGAPGSRLGAVRQRLRLYGARSGARTGGKTRLERRAGGGHAGATPGHQRSVDGLDAIAARGGNHAYARLEGRFLGVAIGYDRDRG